jgi:hypothetical protein
VHLGHLRAQVPDVQLQGRHQRICRHLPLLLLGRLSALLRQELLHLAVQ